MPENERLREVLLEVEALREREQKLLNEGQIGLKILTDLGKAANRSEAIQILINSACDLVGAEHGAVIVHESGVFFDEATHQNIPDFPPNLFSKARNLVDLTASDSWAPLADLSDPSAASALTVPIPGPDSTSAVLVLLGSNRAQFATHTLNTLRRVAKLNEEALRAVEIRANHALLAAVVAGSSSAFAISDSRLEDDPLIFVNTAFETLTGYTRDEVLGKNCRFLNNEPDDSVEMLKLKDAVATKKAGRFLLRNIRKSGELFWNDLTLSPVLGDDGAPLYMVATQTDATARVLAEQDRDVARTRMDRALAHTDDALVLLDQDQTVQFANVATKKMFPTTNDTWQPGTSFRLNWEGYLSALPRSIQTQHPNLISPDLDHLALQKSGMDVTLPDGRVVLVRCNQADTGGYVISATDITALKNAERQTRQRTAAIDNAQDGIGIADDAGRMIYANPSMARLFDQETPDDILGRHWFRAYTHKPEPEFFEDLEQNGRAKEVLITKATPPRHHEISLTRVKGVGTVLIIQDISDRLVAQQKQMEMDRTLELARQREVVSELAAGIAHDFNNILAVINGSAILLSTDDNLNPSLNHHVDRIIRAGQSAAKLVNHMMDLGQADAEDGVFDLKWAVDEALTLATASMAANVNLHPKIAKAAYPVYGAANDAVQVLLNLLINANDALEGKPGEIHVSLDPILAPPEMIAIGDLDPKGKYACICVKDTGRGMSPDTITRIFEPRFTTKGEKGSGIGLSTVATMLSRIGGGVDVTSTPGEGTKFDIYWPLSSIDMRTQDADDTDTSLENLMIMVVDDDRAVTDVLQGYLERLGAEVAVCHDPSVALEALTDDPSDWDILITDYDMPGLSGGDLVEGVRLVTSDLPIFVVTALARRLNDHRITEETVNAVLAKPLNLSKLSAAIAAATLNRRKNENTLGG